MFVLSVPKTNAVTRRSNKSTMGLQEGLLQRPRCSAGTHSAHKGCYAKAVVICGICTDIVQRSLRCHCVFNTPSAQCEPLKAQYMRCEHSECTVSAQRITNKDSVEMG